MNELKQIKRKGEYPSQQFLKECMEYNPITGDAKWKHRPLHHFKTEQTQKAWNTRLAGKSVGNIWKHSKRKTDTLYYIKVHLSGNYYMLHNLIWIYTYDKVPVAAIDHDDGDGLNNRIGNLIERNTSVNIRKSKLSSRNQSGIKGVFWNIHNLKWTATIKYNDKHVHLTNSDDMFYAEKLYSTASYIITGENFNNIEPYGIGTPEYNFVEQKLKNRKDDVQQTMITNTSGYIGVSSNNRGKKWRAIYNRVILGRSDDANICSMMYSTAKLIHTGISCNDVGTFKVGSKEYDEIYTRLKNKNILGD